MQPILKIDLSTGRVGRLPLPETWARQYLGGASLAARLLYAELTPAMDPLGPDAPLLFMTGPLTGTSGPAVGRFVVCGKGPATGLWAESNCGGFWGPELRSAGYDGLWITGKAAGPTLLWINEVQPNNPDGLRDNTGTPQPWVELFNGGTNYHTGIDFSQLFIAPTIAYKVTPQHSLGASVIFAYQRFAAKGLQGFAGFSSRSVMTTSNSTSVKARICAGRAAAATALSHSVVESLLSWSASSSDCPC